MNGKNIPGQAIISASIAHPVTKNPTVTAIVGRMIGPLTLSGRKLRTISALPKTAGITEVKFKVAQNQNWSVENDSAPIYCQFCSRQLASSNSHQTGADAMNKPTYFHLFLKKSDVPVRQKTRASTVRQNPTHRGKKAHWVRKPVRDQLSVQKTITSPTPVQPCTGNLFTRVTIIQLNHNLPSIRAFKAITRQDAW